MNSIPNAPVLSTIAQTGYRTALLSKRTIAENLLELRFEKPDGFIFSAGQFVQFRIPDGAKTVLRSYSVSSAPSDPYLEFCVKLLPEGKASGHFSTLKIGDAVEFQGPQGRFTCASGGDPKVFIATGAGLAPVMSILKDEITIRKSPAVVKVLFGVRSEQDLFWQDRLNALGEQSTHFTFQTTLSQPSETWTGEAGRVTAHAGSFIIPGAHYYLCGSVEMVKDVRAILSEAGADPKKIHFEIF